MSVKKASKPKHQSEAELLTFARTALEYSGLVWFRVNNAPGLFNRGGKICFKPSSMRGFPDLAGYRKDGVGWAMELKKKTGRVEDHQQEWIDKLSASNCATCVARTELEILAFIEQQGGKVRQAPSSPSSPSYAFVLA